VFNWTKDEMGCRNYQAQLEEHLSADPSRTGDREFDAHLRDCAGCREALSAARLASGLVRAAAAPAAPSQEMASDRFVFRVMAAIRDQEFRRALPGAIWRPVEVLASRFALVAAMVLLALSVYLAESGPVPAPVAAADSQAEVGAVVPDPQLQAVNADEGLISLSEADNGY
jgi:hypothetical protein